MAHGGGYFAEVAPNDRLHGVGLSFEHPLASVPVAWRETGSNVLGWAFLLILNLHFPGDFVRLFGPRREAPPAPG